MCNDNSVPGNDNNIPGYLRFEQILREFEQCFSLDAYKALQDGSASGDQDYISEVKQDNERIITSFFQSGKEGLDYLISTLGSTDIGLRERAATVLGELGFTDPSNAETIQEALLKRLEEECERCVRGRIEYALEKVDG